MYNRRERNRLERTMAQSQSRIVISSGFWSRGLLSLALAAALAFPVFGAPQSPSQPAPPPANAPQTAPTTGPTGPTQDPTPPVSQQPAPSQTSPGDSQQSQSKDAKKKDETPIPQKE